MDRFEHHLQSIFGQKNWRTLWQTYALVRNWPKIVGDQVAQRSEPASIQKNTLWIHVSDSVWMQQLHIMRPEMLAKVRDFMPELDIKDIRLAIATAKPAQDESPPRPKKPVDPEQEKAFTRIATTIDNEECRDALCRLWRANNQHR